MTTLVKIRRQGVLTTSNHATLRLALLAQQQARIERAQAIGRRIRELREAKDWSQTQLARELDGSANKDYVSRWERGIHEPEAGYMNKLAEVFDTDVADLMGRPALATPDPVEAMTEDERLSKLEKQLQRIGRQVARSARASKRS